jgi:7,8-dihydro-6-hydroxymethylpterin-pyrophosphokinase
MPAFPEWGLLPRLVEVDLLRADVAETVHRPGPHKDRELRPFVVIFLVPLYDELTSPPKILTRCRVWR